MAQIRKQNISIYKAQIIQMIREELQKVGLISTEHLPLQNIIRWQNTDILSISSFVGFLTNKNKAKMFVHSYEERPMVTRSH